MPTLSLKNLFVVRSYSCFFIHQFVLWENPLLLYHHVPSYRPAGLLVYRQLIPSSILAQLYRAGQHIPAYRPLLLLAGYQLKLLVCPGQQQVRPHAVSEERRVLPSGTYAYPLVLLLMAFLNVFSFNNLLNMYALIYFYNGARYFSYALRRKFCDGPLHCHICIGFY